MKHLIGLLIPVVALFAAQPRYARLGDFEGRVDVQLNAAADWLPAERNLPLPESAWLRTGPASHLEIELDEGSAFRLGPNSQGELSDYSRLSTGQRITLLSLDQGVAYFTGQPEGKDSITLAVPGAEVILIRSARVRLEVQETWSRISVLRGTVRFSSPAAEIDLREGQTTRVEPSNPGRFFLDRETTSMDLDRWSEERDKALTASPSAGHVIERYGLADLDSAGVWIQTEDLGAVWKPKAQDGFVPFQNGRWRWYDALGYTWVSGDSWGWLPYHHGRWIRRENLGWLWVPANSPIFKPGDVYWMRGANLAGWGPLAPGEAWTAPGADGMPPAQFLSTDTTFATFQQDALVIDPSGFTGRPKEPMLVVSFARALPPPVFSADRLEAVRPVLQANRGRVTPIIDGVTFQKDAPVPATVIVNPPPPRPVVIITQASPEPPQTVEVPYPVPVYTGILVTQSAPPADSRKPQPQPSKPAAPSTKPPSSTPPAATIAMSRRGASKPEPSGDGVGRWRPDRTPEKNFRSTAEREIATEVIKDISTSSFAKALTDLDSWSQKFRDSEFKDDRLYYYIVAHNGLQQPGKVVDTATQLFLRTTEPVFQDQRQLILALYLTALNVQRLTSLTREQFGAGQAAARSLLSTVPDYFTAENRPPGTTSSDWTKARTHLEATAKTTLEALAAHPVGRR